MTIDRRFAIVIGINDYSSKPLEYCVNDALAVSQILKDKCYFNTEDIFTITSDSLKPIKDISGHLDNALKQISKDLKPQTDSIFFYFAGHGEYHFENSGLQFHDSFVEISDIFNRINDLQPKYQCFVIDACESGGKVLTRGTAQPVDIIEKYISKSSGILFMYAATESESAKELESIKHGLFTYYFLDAINKEELYDQDDILTPNRIQDYIARETSKGSQFKQTPVIENRTIGYYPFAFKKKPEQEKSEDVEAKAESSRLQSSIDKVYFPEIPIEIRKKVFEEIKGSVDEMITDIFKGFKLFDYELTTGDTLSVFNSKIEDKLTDSIVEKSRKENVEAVNLLFSTERQEYTPNPIFGGFSFIEALSQKKQPKYTYYNRIQWHDEKILAYSLHLRPNNIYEVSCGIVIIIYQAVYGIGLATSSFYMDYTGYSDTQINGPFTNIEAFKVHDKTITNIQQSITTQINYFKGMIDKWNKDRKASIQAFGNKAK